MITQAQTSRWQFWIDRGGTFTDVSHFAGEYERAFDTLVAGVLSFGARIGYGGLFLREGHENTKLEI